MDIILLFGGLIFMFLGIIGCFIPMLPGPVTSWIGLLIISFTKAVDYNWTLLGSTFLAMAIIGLLDYVIPALGAKKFGGSRHGIIGTQVGLLIGLFFFPPFGMLIGAMGGAMIGELIKNKNEIDRAAGAAFGSFLGFLTSTFLKVCLAFTFLIIYLYIAWTHKESFVEEFRNIFSFLN